VSIAKEISFADRFENMGAEIVKEVANKTNDGVGDGTTTTVVLLEAMIDEGMSQIMKGANRDGRTQRHGEGARCGYRGIEEDGEAGGRQERCEAGGLHFSGKARETRNHHRRDGREGRQEWRRDGRGVAGHGTFSYEVVEGMQIDKGYVSAYMVTNPERMEAEMARCADPHHG